MAVLLVEETGVPEKTTDQSQVTDKLYHIIFYRLHAAMSGIQTPSISAEGTDCTGSIESGIKDQYPNPLPYIALYELV